MYLFGPPSPPPISLCHLHCCTHRIPSWPCHVLTPCIRQHSNYRNPSQSLPGPSTPHWTGCLNAEIPSSLCLCSDVLCLVSASTLSYNSHLPLLSILCASDTCARPTSSHEGRPSHPSLALTTHSGPLQTLLPHPPSPAGIDAQQLGST